MLFTTALLFTFLASISCDAKFGQYDSRDNRYIRPGPHSNWQRGPCPGLNVLANHGFIDRDGRNILFQTFLDGAREIYGLDLTPVLAFAKERGVTHFNSAGLDVITLSNLFEHGAMEHDGSFTRPDFHADRPALSESIEIPRIVECLFESDNTKEYVSHEDVMVCQAKIVADSLCSNPFADFSDTELTSTMGVDAMNLFNFGQTDDLSTVSTDNLRSFLIHERIPSDYKTRAQLGFESEFVDSDVIASLVNSFAANVFVTLAAPPECPEVDNSHGEHGHHGEHGESGYRGEHGESGYRGEHGESGYHGEHGEAGYRGESGLYGENGESGFRTESGFRW